MADLPADQPRCANPACQRPIWPGPHWQDDRCGSCVANAKEQP